MKCPNCEKQFTKRKNQCPSCGESLMMKSGTAYKRKDISLANQLIGMLEELYLIRDRVEINLRTSSEFAAAYYIIQEIRKVVNNDKLIIETVKSLLQQDYWFRNVNSLHMLKNHVRKQAVLGNKRRLTDELIKKNQEERLSRAFQGKEHVVELSASI